MVIRHQLTSSAPSQDTVFTIGVFDGVHRGHQHLVGRVVALARERGWLPGVLTFRNRPREVLRPVEPPRGYLMDLEERVRLLRACGAGLVIMVDFTLELSRLTAREFVEQLVRQLRMRALVVGPTFTLGHRREGTPEVLRALGQELGFRVEVVEPITLEGRVASTTAICDALKEGDVGLAARLLGRNFRLQGMVVPGRQMGKALGFPTANLAPPNGRLVPGDGIYATWARVQDRVFKAATNIGVRPTLGPGERVVEAFLIGFQGELYGQRLELEFVERLRNEQRFPSLEALRRQIAQDVEQVQQVLASVLAPEAGG